MARKRVGVVAGRRSLGNRPHGASNTIPYLSSPLAGGHICDAHPLALPALALLYDPPTSPPFPTHTRSTEPGTHPGRGLWSSGYNG